MHELTKLIPFEAKHI